jgi:hypothetical protein
MANTNLSLDLSQSLYLNALNKPNSFDVIYDSTMGRNKARFFSFVQWLSKGQTKKANNYNGRVETLVQPNQYVSAQIASTSVVGSNLVVNFVDTTYNFFRNGFVVRDKSAYQGIVVAHNAGQIVLAPGPNIPSGTWNTATMFVAGQVAYQGENASANFGSTGTESIYTNPSRDYNCTQFFRESIAINRKDLHQTYLNDSSTNKTGLRVLSYQETMMLTRFAFGMEVAAIRGVRAENLSVAGSNTNLNGGLDWAIANRGGRAQAYTSLPTLDDYKDAIQFIRDNSNQMDGSLLWIGGTDARANLFSQAAIQNAIIYSGINATFQNMRDSGFDITVFQWMGLQMAFMDMPIFNDPDFNQNTSTITGNRIDSSTFYILNLNPVPDVDGAAVPPVRLIHFDESPIIQYGYVPGTVGASPGAGVPDSSQFTRIMASGADGVTAHAWFDGGIDIPVAKGMFKGYLQF